jgi:hypothetical protein
MQLKGKSSKQTLRSNMAYAAGDCDSRTLPLYSYTKAAPHDHQCKKPPLTPSPHTVQAHDVYPVPVAISEMGISEAAVRLRTGKEKQPIALFAGTPVQDNQVKAPF